MQKTLTSQFGEMRRCTTPTRGCWLEAAERRDCQLDCQLNLILIINWQQEATSHWASMNSNELRPSERRHSFKRLTPKMEEAFRRNSLAWSWQKTPLVNEEGVRSDEEGGFQSEMFMPSRWSLHAWINCNKQSSFVIKIKYVHTINAYHGE